MYSLSNTNSIIRDADGAIIPAAESNADYHEYIEWLSRGNKPNVYIPSIPEIVAEYERALDSHMDGVAKSYRYDSRYTFALRAAFNGPYYEEGRAFAEWMDQCNFYGLDILNKCLAGEIDIPTIKAFIESLPKFISPK